MKPRVFLTRELPAEAMTYLHERTELDVNPHDRALSREELIRGLEGKNALLCLLTDAVDAEIMDAQPELEVIANYAVGFDNIDVQAATDRGIAVTNTPDVLTETTADMAFALMLATARRLNEGEALVRSGTWRGWAPLQLLGADVHGSTLGLVGLGRIGRAVARRAQGFAMEVLYWNRTPLPPEEETQLGVHYTEFSDLLAKVDFVSLHVAYSEKTHHLIDSDSLARMRPDARLINTARGAIVDEEALVRALKENRIAGAGLDVYEHEPRLAPGLYDLPNVVLAPHLGSATLGARTKMAIMAAENVLAACAGERPPNLVNEAVERPVR